MDRLTEHTPDNFGYAEYVFKPNISEMDAAAQLGAYEDTGLTPENIKSLFRDAGVTLAMNNNDLRKENTTLKKAMELALESQKNGLCYEDVALVVKLYMKHSNRQKARGIRLRGK